MLKSRDIPSLVAQSSKHRVVSRLRNTSPIWSCCHSVALTASVLKMVIVPNKTRVGLVWSFFFWNTVRELLIVIVNTCYLLSLEIFPLNTFPRITVRISTTTESSNWKRSSFLNALVRFWVRICSSMLSSHGIECTFEIVICQINLSANILCQFSAKPF
jgi:hypothetical protein